MLRRLLPVCLVLALSGCNNSTPPASGIGGAGKPDQQTAQMKSAEMGAAATAGNASNGSEIVSGNERPGKQSGADALASDENRSQTAKGDYGSKKKDEKQPPTVAGVLNKLSRNPPRSIEAIKSYGADLEKALETEPDNSDGLLTMAQITHVVASQGEGDEDKASAYRKAADLVRRAIKAKPELAEDPGTRQLASIMIYNEACALARDKKITEAMDSLREAIDYGFSQISKIEKDEDLSELHSVPEFIALVEETREKIKLAARKEVAHLLGENEPFDFEFELDDIAGNKVSKAGLAGNVVIVDIWGTWCPPCRMEIPHFVALDKQYHEKGLRIVGLNKEQVDDDEQAAKLVKDFCEEEGIEYSCALITDEIMNQVPAFRGFPTTLFLDRNGKVRLKVVGLHDISFLEAAVETLLDEKADEDTGG